MEKDSVIKLILSVLLAVYLVVTLSMTRAAARADRYSNLQIELRDSLGSGFVTEADIDRVCGNLMHAVATLPADSLPIALIERRLMEMPQIESANVCRLNDGTLRLDVTPMIPVARVFEPGTGRSYYINASDKRVDADVRYHVDVPVVIGRFDSTYHASSLLPMLSHIAADPTANALVSTITASRSGDIMIIPVIRGQVINFGDTSAVADKFDRLKSFYRQVMGAKGWNYYDTISVKWAGQVVATRRQHSLGALDLVAADADFDDIDDIETMTTDDFTADSVDTPSDKAKR